MYANLEKIKNRPYCIQANYYALQISNYCFLDASLNTKQKKFELKNTPKMCGRPMQEQAPSSSNRPMAYSSVFHVWYTHISSIGASSTETTE